MAHQTKFQVFRKSARKFMSSSINLFIWLTYIWYWILELHCISGLGVVLKCSSKHIWWHRSLNKRPIHPKTSLSTNWAATACQMCMIRIWLTLPVKYLAIMTLSEKYIELNIFKLIWMLYKGTNPVLPSCFSVN